MAKLTSYPLTPERWPDLEKLFGPRGAVGGCWCMWWRLKRSEYERQKGEGNKQAFHTLVQAGPPTGIVVYLEDEPTAWCSLGPRENFPPLANSRVLQRVDDQLVWSIICLFIAKPFRRQGLSSRVIRAAVQYAQEQGATIIEAYPVEPKTKTMPTAFASTGMAAAYLQAGFVEVARRSETRPLMRWGEASSAEGV